ncbi:Uu.00g058100.m01.CDS01 [Anthostomella pinea]|uniref:Uu.00g058100.m01.CDS01 n=1 Tax=Anthostomella pinea TaxID=933095 RepID=A0AAI8VL89_9PEZI|nr:Uu.00g058100.m01.CDS01 [Anthostomella pinea]
MQRLSGSGLSHRLLAKTYLAPGQVRYRHFGRRKWLANSSWALSRKEFPTFEASTLLLDLDAEDSKFVRAYDGELDGVPEPGLALKERQTHPVRERIADFEKNYAADEAAYATNASCKFSPWHISDHDVLSVALLNTPTKPTTVASEKTPQIPRSLYYDQTIGSILDKNGIPKMVRESASKTIPYMMRRQWPPLRLSVVSGDEKLFADALRSCQEFAEIERLVANVMQTPQGCQLVSDSGSALMSVCNEIANDIAPSAILSFLTSLTLSLHHGRYTVPPELLEGGLEASLQCSAFATTQTYLRLSAQAGIELSKGKSAYIISIVKASISSFEPRNTQSMIGHHNADRLLAVFRLLTSHYLGARSKTFSGPGLWEYVSCLAQLGAFRTMWHDFQRRRISKTGHISIGHHATAQTPIVEAYMDAIHEACRTSNGVANFISSPDFMIASGEYEEDCRLDMEDIRKSADMLAMQGTGSSLANGFKRAPNVQEQMMAILSKRPIRGALLDLQAFLVNKQASLL